MGRLYALQQERKSKTACCVEKELLKERSNGTVESESTETTADCSYNSITNPVVRMSEDPFIPGSHHSLQHAKAFNHIGFHDDFVGGFDETVPEHCEVEFYDIDEEAEDADESLHPETDDFYPFLAHDDDDNDDNAGKSLHILRDGNDASFSSFTSFASFASHDNEGAAGAAHQNSSRNLLAASRNNALSRHSITHTMNSLRFVKKDEGNNHETGGPLPNQLTGSSSCAVAGESESIGTRRTSAIRSNPRDTQPRSTRRHSAVTLPTGSSHSSGRPEPWQQSARRLSMASASSAPLTYSQMGPSPALRETRRLTTRRSGGMRPGSLTQGSTMASPIRSVHRLSASSLNGITSPGMMATPKSAVTSTPRVLRRRRVSISQLKAPCLDDTEAVPAAGAVNEARPLQTKVEELSPKPEQAKEQASLASSSKHSPRTKPSSSRRLSASGRRSSASSEVSVKSTPRMPSEEQAVTETDPVADSKSVKSGHHHTSRRSSVSSENSKKRTEEDSSEKSKQSRLHAGKREHHRHHHHHKHHHHHRHHHSPNELTTEKGSESFSVANERNGAPLPAIPNLTPLETLTEEKRTTSVSSSIREQLAQLKETTRRRPSHHATSTETDICKKSSSNTSGGVKDNSSVVVSSPYSERQRLRRSSASSARSQKSSLTEPYEDEKKSNDDADYSNNGAARKEVPSSTSPVTSGANHRRSVLTTRTRTKATRSDALHHK